MTLKEVFKKFIPMRFRNSDGENPTSIVLLLKQPHFFADEELRAAAEKAWNRTFEGGEESRHFIVQARGITFIKVGPHVLNILHAASPYFGPLDDAELNEFLPEVERQHAWRSHHAWCAVDYKSKNTDEHTKYCVLAALVAEMVNENCSGIWVPKFRGFMPNAAFNGMLLYPELKKLARAKEIDLD
jgi:hypothetical protein